MSLKNLNASKKTHKFLLDKLKDKKTLQIYKKFEKNLPNKKKFIVAVSGGPDSLALSFLAKIYSIIKSIDIKYFIVDHRLRKNSKLEAKDVQKKLKNFSIKLNILTWKGKKPKKNIQSIAREKRYKLLTDEAKKYKINYILLGHQLDDLFENFFIRILRGSGLKGLISLDKEAHLNQVNLIRPLIEIDKKDLIYISNYIFGSYVKDPSNEDDKFKRVYEFIFSNSDKIIGVNASSIAEITGIPRATVIRKLKYASKFGLLVRDKNQLYVIKKLSPVKMKEFAKIASTIQQRTYKFIGTFFELYKNKAQLPQAK